MEQNTRRIVSVSIQKKVLFFFYTKFVQKRKFFVSKANISSNEVEQWYVRHSYFIVLLYRQHVSTYEGWNFNSGNYLFTTDTK